MTRARRVCTTPGCPELVTTGRCPNCRRTADQARGTRQQRGYDTRWERRRATYLARHPFCQLCPATATVADHWPRSRRDLVAAGVPDPDADQHLRPLCAPCHSRQTAQHQPGGWHA